jgi:hypothetical protein
MIWSILERVVELNVSVILHPWILHVSRIKGSGTKYHPSISSCIHASFVYKKIYYTNLVFLAGEYDVK